MRIGPQYSPYRDQGQTPQNPIDWDRLALIPANYLLNGIALHTLSAVEAGDLGIVGKRVIFKFAPHSAHGDLEFNLTDVAYFSLLTHAGFGPNPLLIVHQLDGWQWYIHAFQLTGDRLRDFVRILRLTYPNAPLAPFPDYGPANVRPYEQDIYGVWQPAEVVQLYLTPDRLLVNNRTHVRLDQIKRLRLTIDVPHGLRIDYQMPDDPRPLFGSFHFLQDNPQQWGDILSQRTSIPLEIESGRKKKNS